MESLDGGRKGRRLAKALVGLLSAALFVAAPPSRAQISYTQPSAVPVSQARSSGIQSSGAQFSGGQQPATQINQDSAADPLYGSVTSVQSLPEVLPLSLDEAIRRGLEHNLQLALAEQDRRVASGERLQAINYLMPTLTWQAERSRNQYNLEALGFSPKVLASFPPGVFPASAITNFNPVVTANVVSAQANLQQSLFDLRSLELYRAAKEELRGVDFSYQGARQDVVLTVAASYLQALAQAANVANAQGLLATNAEILRRATFEHEAGTAARLDELRARVQYHQQQEIVVAQQNAFEKDKIALEREIGLPADQKIRLTDTAPYAELDAMPLDQALAEAYTNRQDYRLLQVDLRSAKYQNLAALYERAPTLSFGGNYGVVGTVGGIYHGVFFAQGELSVPLFREAKFRGDRDVARASEHNALSQLANLRSEIEAQLRDSLLDIAASRQLVEAARSNVDLAQFALRDATDRFTNGVDDDLPVVQAQASVASAQAQLVNSLYRYNLAKLGMARNLGIIDQQYRAYLGK